MADTTWLFANATATAAAAAATATETAPPSGADVAVALGLVVLSAGATSIGSAVVFFPKLVNLANSHTLAICLSGAAGVMTLGAFCEILQKSKVSFIKSGYEENIAFSLSMACFFSGVAVMMVRTV